MKPKDATLSHDDFVKFIDTVTAIPPFHMTLQKPPMNPFSFQIFYKMLYYCALTPEEARSLKKENFDLENKILKIKKQNSVSETTIPPILWGDLKNFLENKNDNEYIFSSNITNRPITRQVASTYAKTAGRMANLDILQFTQKKEIEGVSLLLFRESYKQFMLNHEAHKGLVELKFRSKTSNRYGGYSLHDLKKFELNNFKITFSQKEIIEILEWYKSKFSLFEGLSKEVYRILSTVLKQRKIKFQDIMPRVKSPDSFQTKLQNGTTFVNPKQTQDLAGIRVVCFAKSDVLLVCNIIEKIFSIISKKGGDDEKIIPNISGYSDIQYVCKLPKARINSAEELKQFENIRFEIQVRTILQHAWAEIEHDDLYKNPGQIPSSLRRRFFLVSNVLESADNELNELHKKIEGLKKNKKNYPKMVLVTKSVHIL